MPAARSGAVLAIRRAGARGQTIDIDQRFHPLHHTGVLIDESPLVYSGMPSGVTELNICAYPVATPYPLNAGVAPP